MRPALQVIGIFVAAIATALWFFSGPNFGWTKTSQERRVLDPVTGIEEIQYVKSFLPGVDFWVAGLVGGGLVAALSLLFPSNRRQAVASAFSEAPDSETVQPDKAPSHHTPNL